MGLDDKVEFKLKALSKGLAVHDIYILILGEKNGSTLFPIPVKKEQEMMLSQLITPFQQTHSSLLETFRSMCNASGVIITSVCINNIYDGDFKADVFQIHDGEETTCEVSAGDAIILAIYFRIPIYVDKKLLKEAFSNKDNHTFSFSIKSLSKDMLEEAMKDAVKNEQYEIASIIRDELKKRHEGN